MGDSGGSSSEATSLIINYLPQSLTDEQFHQLFEAIGPMLSARVMRNRATGYSFGYGFVNYERPEDAAKAIEKLNGLQLEHKRIKVAYSRKIEGTNEEIKNANVFVSNLPKSMDVEQLKATFAPYGEIVQAKILTEHGSGVSKGCGFVLFSKTAEADLAIQDLNGAKAPNSTNLMVVKKAQDSEQNRALKHGTAYPAQGSIHVVHHYHPFPGQATASPFTLPVRSASSRNANRYNPITSGTRALSQGDPDSGHTLFIYNTGPNITETELYALFGPFGAITKVHVQRDPATGMGKGFGFVTYDIYDDAVNAIQAMNGYENERNGYKPLQVSFKTSKRKSDQ